jgi:hypothetical protein
MAKLPGRLASERFTAFIDDGHLSQYRLDKLKEAFGIEQDQMLRCLVDVLPSHMKELPATVLYDIAIGFASQLNSGVAISTLQWALPDLVGRVRSSGPDLLGMSQSDLPTSSDELEAAILWYLFGHPVKQIRWKAVHTARQLVRLGYTSFLQALAEWLKQGTNHPFASPDAVFYWLAARQWCFVLIDRLSAEYVDSILPLSATIADEVLSPREPHALITHFARRAALRLAKHSSKPLTARQTRRIAASLVSPFKPKKENTGSLLRRGRKKALPCRFQFDTIDTIPYWYERVARMFASSTDEFCHDADHWICDKWGFVGDVWEKDITHKWPDRGDWGMTSHSHGSPPQVENLATYLEFNAMFCVAAEWIAKKPTVESDWDDDRWKGWLDRWDLETPSTWAADKRQRTPMEAAFWIRPAIDRWDSVPTDADFDATVGLLNPLHKGCLVVDGSLYRYVCDDYEHVDIYSALVSPSTAQALLHALHNSRHPHDYRVPHVDDELEISETLGGVQFSFKGWIEDKFSDSEGIDQHDPFRYHLKNVARRPGSMFAKKMGVTSTGGSETAFRSRESGLVVAQYELWDDCRRGRYEHEFRTEGNRLWMDIGQVCEYLRKGNWSLLLKCEINHHSHDTSLSKKWNEYEINTKLYLITKDGSVEAIAGRYCSREDDR